jgi:hypothetical protein
VHASYGLERLDEAHAVGREIGHGARRVALGDRRAAPQGLAGRWGLALARTPVDDDLDLRLVGEVLAQRAHQLVSPIGLDEIDEPRLLVVHY